MFNQYPYTDGYELNTDWIISKIKNVETSEANAKQSAEDADTARQGAVDAQGLAEAAQRAAEDAQEGAETAQGLAEDARDAARDAQGDAEALVRNTQDQMDLLQARVDNIIPDGTQTAGNTELLDIRVGYTGKIYDSAGNAVRGQVSDLQSQVTDIYEIVIPPHFTGTVFSQHLTYLDLPVYMENSYIDNDGVTQSVANWDIYKYSVLDYARYMAISKDSTWATTTYKGRVYYKDGTSVALDTTLLGGIACKDIDYILLNINETDSKGYGIIDMVYNQRCDIFDGGKIAIDTNDNVYLNEYIDDTGNAVTLKGCQVSKIPMLIEYEYYLMDDSYSHYGACYDSNDTFIDKIRLTGDKITIPVSTAYILVNLSANAYIYALPKSADMVNVVSKPYSFVGKNAAFFGDSITKGIASSSGGLTTLTTEAFVSLTVDKLGLSALDAGSKNYAQSSTTIAVGYVPNGSILTRLENANLSTYDIIIIDGGTNDYGNDVPLGSRNSNDTSTFYGALNDMMTYIQTNASADQDYIFILPITRINEDVRNAAGLTLNDYRQAMYEKALEYGFDVINGADFGFPKDSWPLQTKLIYDGLHPTVLGHAQYAKVLCSILS